MVPEAICTMVKLLYARTHECQDTRVPAENSPTDTDPGLLSMMNWHDRAISHFVSVTRIQQHTNISPHCHERIMTDIKSTSKIMQ